MTWRCSLTSNLRQGALIFVGFHNIFLFWLQALLWEGQGYLWEKMPQNVKKSSIWSPFLARGIEWRCFEVDEFFQGLLPVPCFLWKMSFEMPIFCLDKLINSCTKSESFWARNLERSKTVFPILYSFSKKCHENENAVFNTAKWLRILMHPTDAFKFWIFWCTRSKMSGCT